MLDQEFKKSSSCIIGGCIEARLLPKEEVVEIKNCEKEVLKCSVDSWKHFIQGVKVGEFDV